MRGSKAYCGLAVWAGLFCCYALVAGGEPSQVERLSQGVVVIRDEGGNWGGPTAGITHQRGPDYQAKKLLDLTGLSPDIWDAADELRLSAYFCVRDYSFRESRETNGLDETVEIVVNGHVHRFDTNSGLPVYDEGRPVGENLQWHDLVLPKSHFLRGPNEVVFRLSAREGKKPDDYLYLGIDTAAPGGNSWVKFSGGNEWRQDKLTIPGGRGEYMVRLYLLKGARGMEAAWSPRTEATDDPAGLLLYAGSHGGASRVEWEPRRIDRLAPLTVTLETQFDRPMEASWLDEKGQPVSPPVSGTGPRFVMELRAPLMFRPAGVQLGKSVAIQNVLIKASEAYHPIPPQVDIAPAIAPARGVALPRDPICTIGEDEVVLENDNLRCRFSRQGGRLGLVSLHNALADAEMVRDAGESSLFLIEVEGKRYAGNKDFSCTGIEALAGRNGFTATLQCDGIGLEAAFRVWVDHEVRMGLTVTNRGESPADFKVAFPHLAGLAVSDDPADDYYFFPWGGGIISDAPVLIRRGYGDHAALYQFMDLFSPERGAGLMVRCTDDDGRYKVLALRKHVPGRAEMSGDDAQTPTADEYKWRNCLPPIPGTGFTFEYLRRTRAPGESFPLKEVALKAHSGDWRVAMRAYADWCHEVWEFRPWPSRLTPMVNMIAAGWGQSPLFRDGAYRTDFVQSRCDCIELMSWWEWSDLGPWRTPWDKLEEKLGEAQYRRYKPYYVADPVTGKTMYPINRGDYDGYNERWGGLQALRDAIKTYRDMGAVPTLYTDPLLACDNSKCGQRWGKQWGIVQPDGEYRTHYQSWNMCHDVAEYRQFVADTMARVMRETDADGIRLDEYGHGGAACFSELHKHTFAERGCTEWLRAIAETSRMVREAMDEVKPGSVLTTEHPGYDYLMPIIDGCITYDLTVQATPLRPLECNLQRFFFNECKPFELDHRGADKQHRKRFWNAVASFGSYYPPNMDAILRENADAFEHGHAAPLVPTLARYVYANRFEATGKRVFMLYNATGHTFFGDVLSMDVEPQNHVFDLLNCREVAGGSGAGPVTAKAFLERDGVACFVRLPVRLAGRREGEDLVVAVRYPSKGLHVRLCDSDGQPLAEKAAAESVRFDLNGVKEGAPACVKLLEEGRLVDALGLPK